MPLFSDENRIRELERKVNRLIAENRDLKQQMLQAQQLARALANTQAQGGQQPPATIANAVFGAKVTTAVTTGPGNSGPGTAGSGVATIYPLAGTGTGTAITGQNVYCTFSLTTSIATGTWLIVQLDGSGAYQIIAGQC